MASIFRYLASALKIWEIRSSGMSVDVYQTTRLYSLEVIVIAVRTANPK